MALMDGIAGILAKNGPAAWHFVIGRDHAGHMHLGVELERPFPRLRVFPHGPREWWVMLRVLWKNRRRK